MTIVKTHINFNLFLSQRIIFSEYSGVFMQKRHTTIIIIFISGTGQSIASKFFEMKCETIFNLIKKFD